MATTPRLRWHERFKQPVSQFFADSRLALIATRREPGYSKHQSKHHRTARLADGPFGLLTIPTPKHTLMPNNSGDLTMHRTLLLHILACLIASAHADPKTTPYIVKPESVTQVTLQLTSEVVKVRATRETLATPGVKESTHVGDGGWGKYGTLLATLVVMCAIALRRQRLRRP